MNWRRAPTESAASGVAESESPQPGMSIARTRKRSESGPMFGEKLLHPDAPGPEPWIRISGCPVPASW